MDARLDEAGGHPTAALPPAVLGTCAPASHSMAGGGGQRRRQPAQHENRGGRGHLRAGSYSARKPRWKSARERSNREGKKERERERERETALANLIASRLDARLAGFIETLDGQWSYTRYADDLTFSTTDEEPPIGQLIATVGRIAKDENFEIKAEKTRIMRSPRRQSVTGLIVGDEVRIPKATIKKMRALFHNIETRGKDVVSEELGKDAINVARGYWAYLYMVSPTQANKYLIKHKWLRK